MAMRMPVYKGYLLGVLLVLLAFNTSDGLALGLVLQNIKLDLGLSDTQLGFLSGIAFALFYSFMGIPIGIWADRGNRVTIISLTSAAWSVMVALCGMAHSFTQLLVIRVGVAVGEAGCVPPSHSLVADHFSRGERPRAVAIYMLGGSLGVVIGYFVAGWLNELYGWRMMFTLLGAAGLVPAILARLTLEEPRCAQPSVGDRRIPAPGAVPLEREPQDRPPSLKVVCTVLWASRTFRHLLIGFSVINFFGNGIAQWQPAFFIRSFGLKTAELGTWFAVIYGVAGVVGMYLGGEVASRCATNNERLQLKGMATVYAGFSIVSALIYICPNYHVAFALMGCSALFAATVSAPLFATIQTLVPQRMRATSIAIIYLFANLIGLGLGPLAAGILSDLLRPWAGEESLRYALMLLCPGILWAVWHLWRASVTVERDLEALKPQAAATTQTEQVDRGYRQNQLLAK